MERSILGGKRMLPRVLLAIERALQEDVAIYAGVLLAREREAIAAREQLLSVVAHDVRSPLATLVAGTTLLLETVDDEECRAHLRRMDRAAQAAVTLLNDLVEVSQIEAGGLAITASAQRVEPLLLEVMDRHQLVCRERQVGLATGPTVPAQTAVSADPDQLHRVFDNLIRNALKFTPPGERITIAAHFAAGDAGDHVRFTVTDSGPGIPPPELPRVFDRFWQGRERQRAGAGLGLAIAKGIVEAHGGRIWATNETGGGAQFHFTIPCAFSTPAAATGAA